MTRDCEIKDIASQIKINVVPNLLCNNNFHNIIVYTMTTWLNPLIPIVVFLFNFINIVYVMNRKEVTNSY